MVFKEYNENAGASRDPMRAVQTRRWLYLFNPWSNGQRVMATATTGTPTYRRLAQLAETDEQLAARHNLYRYRVVEELYDVSADPDCLVNLIDKPAHQAELAKLRSALEAWMVKTGDHMLEVFRKRADPEAREAYVRLKEREAEGRKRRKTRAKRQAAGRRKKSARLITLMPPKVVAAGKPVTVKIQHRLKAALGEQSIHVTLKAGPNLKRLDRKVVKVAGNGEVEVTFSIPPKLPGNAVRFAAFVGKDYASNLQHLQTPAIKVR